MSTYEYEDTTVKIAPFSTTKNLLGYDPVLAWKDFSYSAFPLSTDSASAATAMASGVKTFNGAIGVDVAGNPVQVLSPSALRSWARRPASSPRSSGAMPPRPASWLTTSAATTTPPSPRR